MNCQSSRGREPGIDVSPLPDWGWHSRLMHQLPLTLLANKFVRSPRLESCRFHRWLLSKVP